MRLLKLDPVFDELRGRQRLRVWFKLRVRFRIRGWLINHDIIKPARGFAVYGGPKRKRRWLG